MINLSKFGTFLFNYTSLIGRFYASTYLTRVLVSKLVTVVEEIRFTVNKVRHVEK